MDNAWFEESMVGMQRAERENVFLDDGVVTDEVEAKNQGNDQAMDEIGDHPSFEESMAREELPTGVLPINMEV